MQEGVKHNLNFQVVTEGEFDFRIAFVGEWSAYSLGGAQTAAVVLSADCEVIVAEVRSGRWSKSGAARAVGKQLAKDFGNMAKLGQPKRSNKGGQMN